MTLLTKKKYDICVILVVSAAAKVHPNKNSLFRNSSKASPGTSNSNSR